MPLMDHFQSPLRQEVPWSGFHADWASAIAHDLNERWLPPHYRAVPSVTLDGGAVEIDVATLKEAGWKESAVEDRQTLFECVEPTGTTVLDFAKLETFEVLVLYDNGEVNLMAAVELISPSNKDRPQKRQAFAMKCANYLGRRISLLIVDTVTERRANMHASILDLLEVDPQDRWQSPTDLYAVSYRSRQESSHTRIDWWPEALQIGAAMPRMRLWIGLDICVPIGLESTYLTTCHGLRIPVPANESGS